MTTTKSQELGDPLINVEVQFSTLWMSHWQRVEIQLGELRVRLLELFDTEAWLLERLKYNILTKDKKLSREIGKIFLDTTMRARSITALTPVKPGHIESKTKWTDIVLLFEDRIK
jgi:hypothetical protein